MENFFEEKNKRFCLYCGKEIVGKNKSNRKFCSHSCAASFNNKGIVRNGNEQIITKCLYCGKEIKGKKHFCTNECKLNYNYETFISKWTSNEDVDYHPTYIKRFLYELHDNKCEKCGWGEINPFTNRTTLEIHHKDGDCTNNKFNNLELLCPNCHSLTENYKALNENSKRIDRRTKYFKIEMLSNFENEDNKRCVVCGKQLKDEQFKFCSLICKHKYDINHISKDDIINAYNISLNKTKIEVASILRISTTTLNKKIKKFNLIEYINNL